MAKSTIRDGWGILLNACNHITDQVAIAWIEQHRAANMLGWSKEWVLGSYPIDKG